MKTLALAGFLFISLLARAAAPTISSFSPTTASSGTVVTINGTNLSTVTSVSFGGTAATSFIIVSATQISAVVGTGASGQVTVVNPDGNGNRSGFNFISTTAIYTDFGGYWFSSSTSVNTTIPDNSHTLLAFTYNGVTYSTGAVDNILTGNGVTATPANYRALPVATIVGNTPGSGSSTYLALAKKVDGSPNAMNTPAVANFTVKSVLVDGINGLDLGTGVTNLPSSAIMSFQIFNIVPSAISDARPDIVLTQIAQPVSGNDQFAFIDGSGNVVGNTLVQDMTMLPSFGTYSLDLFNLTPNTPYSVATAYSGSTQGTREIRVTALRLLDFGITPGNVSQVKALRITPSGNSDYAFIAYNTDAINLPPNLTRNDATSNTTICSGGIANLNVIGTSAGGGSLSYSWERSTDGGNSWSPVVNDANHSGATTSTLKVTGPSNGWQYRSVVSETGNPNPGTSPAFTIAVNAAPPPPSAVSISGAASVCLNTPVQLSSNVTGGSNLNFQWQTDASGSYVDIVNAVLPNYTPPVNQTGTINYRVVVTSGSGCSAGINSSPASVIIAGISSTSSNAVCASGSMTLTASATAGTIDWYNTDVGGSSIFTGTSYITPTLTNTVTYYVSASGCSAALRVPVVARVHPATVGGAIAGGVTVAPGINTATLMLTGATGSVVKWQSSIDNFISVVNDIGETAPSLTIANLAQTSQYRALVQSGTCPSALSTSATIVVGSTLPLRPSSLRAIQQRNGVSIRWTAYDLAHTDHFQVERSGDGLIFASIGTVAVSQATGYELLDPSPLDGDNLYRVKEIFKSGGHNYSNVVKLKIEKQAGTLRVIPNPVAGNILHFEWRNPGAGAYQVQLLNSIGQPLVETTLVHNGVQDLVQDLVLPASVKPGSYLLLVRNKGKVAQTLVAVR